jgi:hypothetical protein
VKWYIPLSLKSPEIGEELWSFITIPRNYSPSLDWDSHIKKGVKGRGLTKAQKQALEEGEANILTLY